MFKNFLGVIYLAGIKKSQRAAEAENCARLEETTGESKAPVAVKTPGLKGVLERCYTWHHVAWSWSLKRTRRGYL